jgi:hypothetical protein
VKRLSLLFVASATLAACQAMGLLGTAGGPYPDGCAGLGFELARCEAIVARALATSGVDPDSVASVDVLERARDDPVRLGGYMLARVRLHLSDGSEHLEEVWCTGIGMPDDRVCAADPVIFVGAGLSYDVPCTGPAPGACATLPPTPRPEVVAIARPLEVAALDVPLDRTGLYEIPVGDAGLPDGALTEASLRLAQPRPTTFWIMGGVRLEVRPQVPGRPPIGNIHRDPFPGVEPVEAVLVFEVTEVSPGATLEVRDIVVR